MPPRKPKPPSTASNPRPPLPEPTTNARIFNPQAYFPTDLLENPNQPSLPREITLYDPDTTLTNLLFFARVMRRSGFFYRTVISKFAETKEDELVICVAGVNAPNAEADKKTWEVGKEEEEGTEGHEHRGRAAYGVFFGLDSPFNACGLVGSQDLQNGRTAELNAVRITLQCFQQTYFWKDQRIRSWSS
jgi:hypothetical protein